MRRGLFLVLEGIEGAGKTTQLQRVSRWFDELELAHVVAREPGGTEVGEEIREILLDRRHASLPVESELFLMLAARSVFVRRLVEPALDRGDLVLADRYDLSTLAYQGYGRGLELDVVRRANRLATGGLAADLYLLLDVDVEEGVSRQRKEGKEEDRIEGAGLDFLRRVRDGYRELADREERIERIEARGSVSEVQERLRTALRTRFPETFSRSRV